MICIRNYEAQPADEGQELEIFVYQEQAKKMLNIIKQKKWQLACSSLGDTVQSAQ